MGRVVRIVLALPLTFVVAGCDDDDPPPPPAPVARIRVLHLSRDAGTVDVNANGAALVTGVSFTEGSTYIAVAPGDYTLDIGPGVLSTPVLPLAANTFYTAVAFDDLASLQALALTDDLGAPAAGNIRVRVIHAAVGVGQVDVLDVTGMPAALFSDVDFGAATAEAEIAAGTYSIGIDTDDDGTAELTYDLPALAAGTIVNVFAVKDTDDTVFLLAQFSNSAVARINARTNLRVIHVSRDAGLVDVFEGGANLVVEDLAFEASTDYLALTEGTYTFDVAPADAGVGASVLTISGLNLAASTFYTAVALDDVASIQALPLTDDLSAPAAGNIRVRAIHAAPLVGQVDIYDVTGAPALLFENVDFGTATTASEIPEGTYVLGIDVDDDGTSDLTFNLPNLPAGTVANVYAAQDTSDNVFLVAQLAGDVTASIPAN
jgi:hypothetical protein